MPEIPEKLSPIPGSEGLLDTWGFASTHLADQPPAQLAHALASRTSTTGIGDLDDQHPAPAGGGRHYAPVGCGTVGTRLQQPLKEQEGFEDVFEIPQFGRPESTGPTAKRPGPPPMRVNLKGSRVPGVREISSAPDRSGRRTSIASGIGQSGVPVEVPASDLDVAAVRQSLAELLRMAFANPNGCQLRSFPRWSHLVADFACSRNTMRRCIKQSSAQASASASPGAWKRDGAAPAGTKTAAD